MWRYICLVYFVCGVDGYGYMLLYKPLDVTSLCAHSNRIMFDVTFGMGMSDTLTLSLQFASTMTVEMSKMDKVSSVGSFVNVVLNMALGALGCYFHVARPTLNETAVYRIFRGLDELDYWCEVQILSASDEATMIFVVRFPTMAVYQNCILNPGALMVVIGDSCVRVCSFATKDTVSPYIVMSVKDNLTFQFTSNSSINQYIFANFYQVTITTARFKPKRGCAKKNETDCMVNGVEYCFTSGVSCDGIKNCGVEDWFDERRSECIDIEDNLKIWTVLAFLALFCFVIIAGCHLLIRCLPPITGSFFIFTANEDNRLCIDPKLVPSGSPPDIAIPRQPSIIPVSSCSSSDNFDAAICFRPVISKKKEEEKKTSPLQRKMTKTITEKVTSKFRSLTNYTRSNEKPEVNDV